MTASNPLINPLFASSSSSTSARSAASRRTTQTTARIGAYSGVVVAGWLVAAVASGYGVAAADTTGSSSDSSTSASSGDSSSGATAAKPESGSAKGVASKPRKSGPPSLGLGKDWRQKAGGSKRPGKTATTKELAPGVTVSSSGGARNTADEAVTSIGAQEESASSGMAVPASGPVPSVPATTVDQPLEVVSSIADKVRSTVLDLPGINNAPERPATDVEMSHVSDTAQPLASPSQVKIGDRVKQSLDRVERVTGVISEKVSEEIADKLAEPKPASTGYEAKALAVSTASDVQVATAAVVAPKNPVANPVEDAAGVLNGIVTNLLNPFLAPSPDSPEPFTPMAWAVLGWVRRNLFNQAPVVSNPTTTVQTGQTVTGNIGVTDAEGDALTYTVTQQPQHGTVTIDQETGEFTYTPDDINYEAAQTDTFTVSVTDGDKINLLALFKPRTAQKVVDVTVLSPAVERVILDLPDDITNPNRPRFSADGKSIYFGATPVAGGRDEVYQMNIDGTDLRCLTCGVTTSVTDDLQKPLPFEDGSGRVLIRVTSSTGSYTYAVLEDGVNGRELVPLTTPDSPTYVVDRQREMKISPDGTHVLFSRLELGTNGYVAIVPVVGKLVRTDNGYAIDDARVVAPYGEGKSWTPDGKSVIIMGGQYDAGNVDAIKVDLATGNITRETAGLDYEENVFESPNEQWIVTGSTRGLNALTPMSRIARPAFLPAYIVGPVYNAYASPVNVSNQAWVIAVGDELERENGLPLIVEGDGYAGQSMPGWNNDGTAVAFWEQSNEDPTDTRLVIANLKYTTSVGPLQGDNKTPELSSTLPKLSTYVPSAPELPPTGTYAGAGGGTAVVSEAADPTNPGHTIRTVTYTNYVNEDGMILNGTEATDSTANQLYIHYTADVSVTGTHTGYLKGDATITNRQTYSGYITSDVDGDVQSILDQNAINEAQQNV
ncbi:hypothetical protein B7435_26380 [Mycolicibacterium peregrinum]|nr:PD40 domain-containing protein [Mycolicibacterium peregrinum]OWL97123.1 hypothetical protein B7435_26380 [Mycolicibacterium peregrinum]